MSSHPDRIARLRPRHLMRRRSTRRANVSSQRLVSLPTSQASAMIIALIPASTASTVQKVPLKLAAIQMNHAHIATLPIVLRVSLVVHGRVHQLRPTTFPGQRIQTTSAATKTRPLTSASVIELASTLIGRQDVAGGGAPGSRATGPVVCFTSAVSG